MSIQVCTDKHPHMKKFNELCEFANTLGISLHFLGFRTYVEIDGETYDLEDEGETVHEFPPTTEVKLVRGR